MTFVSKFFIDKNDSAESILDNLFNSFNIQKPGEKLYVIIDEYDHFANELLGFNVKKFKELVSKNGKVRKWYEILKQGTESIVERIFITGVAPITLDSLTSGFNIVRDMTRDLEFNEMFGFTVEEIKDIMKEQEIEEEADKLLPIMKENYDGYKFALEAEEQIYNSNMSLYFLNEYVRYNKIPNKLMDVNIASDYSKLAHMLNLCEGENRVDIIEKTIRGEEISSNIVDKFNPEERFTEEHMISMLFYLGYLTISRESFGMEMLRIPNKIMKELYAEYFLHSVEKTISLTVSGNEYNDMIREIALDGTIEKIISILSRYLNNLSNRDFMNFDEKYVKVLFYSIVMNFRSAYWVKSEMEVERRYPDLLLVPRDSSKGYYAILIEFKYIKREDASLLLEKQLEAREQVLRYLSTDEIQSLGKLKAYSVVAINDEMFVEEVVE